MNFENINIIADNIEITTDCAAKVRQIANTTKRVAMSPEITIRLIKNGETFEGLLWGKLDHTPIGGFNSAHSVSKVLENLSKRVQRDCLKILREKVRHRFYDPKWDREPTTFDNVG